MLTPVFQLSQTEDYVIVRIEAKYAKIADAEVHFHGNDFKFHAKPYYLRLTLPNEVENVDDCDYARIATYDCDSGVITINVAKKNKGEHFPDLDMLTKLLAIPSKKQEENVTNNIEVLSGEDELLDEEMDWHVEQIPATNESLTAGHPYGFADLKSGVWNRLQEEMGDVVDVKDPDTKSNEERRAERIAAEGNDFSDEHYLANKLEDEEEIARFLSFVAPWEKDEENLEFTNDEKFVLKELPRREYLLSPSQLHFIGLGLVDLIFSYAYEIRTTFGESNVESGWTIRKLSPTLSWFEKHSCLKTTVESVMRRSLTYPLYRHWKLSLHVLNDVKKIFSLGRTWILKCLLDIRRIFIDGDCRYILNEFYIIDYCIWIQKLTNKFIQTLSESLSELKIEKKDLDLDLEELEAAAEEVQMEQLDSGHKHQAKAESENVKGICDDLGKIQLTGKEMAKAKENPKKETDSEETDSEDTYETDSSADYYLDSDDCSDDGN